MRISVVSDLHLECGYQTLPGGEVLILSGDIAETKNISKHFHSTKLKSSSPIESYACSEFFQHECAKYDKVFYVLGNHEHYQGRIDKTLGILKEMIPSNVSILENSYEEYQGVIFLGATLWTDLNGGDPLTEFHLKNMMNDYRAITMRNSSNGCYHRLTPDYTRRLHNETLAYFRAVLNAHRDCPVVVMTHHAPTSLSINEKYKHDYLGNGSYVSRLEYFIAEHPQIKLWTHGHVHDACDYMVDNTRVVCNPRGYLGYETNTGFDANLSIEL